MLCQSYDVLDAGDKWEVSHEKMDGAIPANDSGSKNQIIADHGNCNKCKYCLDHIYHIIRVFYYDKVERADENQC